MGKSIFLARVIGLYLLVLSVALLINLENLSVLAADIMRNPGFMFVIGMMLLIVGCLLVVSHNIWERSWVVVITLLAWGIFIKGITYLLFPDLMQEALQLFFDLKSWAYVGVLINFIISLFLCYKGFLANGSNRFFKF